MFRFRVSRVASDILFNVHLYMYIILTCLYAEDQGLQVPMDLEYDTPLKSWPES